MSIEITDPLYIEIETIGKANTWTYFLCFCVFLVFGYTVFLLYMCQDTFPFIKDTILENIFKNKMEEIDE